MIFHFRLKGLLSLSVQLCALIIQFHVSCSDVERKMCGFCSHALKFVVTYGGWVPKNMVAGTADPKPK